jgi:PBP1b-binding outer membrane lipoprotein LpoB
MKGTTMKSILFVLLAVLLVGCSRDISYRKVIPERNVEKATAYVTQQMEALKSMGTRYENEDYDDFLEQAQRNALNMYGVDTVGMFDNSNSMFYPYHLCSVEDRQRIDKYLGKK